MTATMIRGSLACPPRFGTPRTSRPTLGNVAGVIAARLRKPLMPWQQHVADVALELDDDGSLVYSEVDLICPRQEGKTELKFVVMVTRLTAMVATHGPQRVTYTMQDRKKARTRLERDYAPRLRRAAGFKEIRSTSRDRPTKRHEWRLGMNSGVEHIQFGPDSWLQIDTPSRTGGHGDTLDLGMIDEAFAHQDDTVEQGMEPAMLTRHDSQLWVMSAAGDARSLYLWRKILRGRQLVDEGADAGVAYFEWSAPDEAEPGDPATWRACCPALGMTIDEARIEALWSKAQASPEGVSAVNAFRRAYLAQWPEVPVFGEDVRWSAVPAAVWAERAWRGHEPSGSLRYALDVDQNAKGETWAAIACSDGNHVEIVTPDKGQGTGWVVAACVAKKPILGSLLVAQDAPAAALIPDLERAGITVQKVTPEDFCAASMGFLDGVIEGSLAHIDQPTLNAAVAGVQKRDVGDGKWRWSRKLSTVDIAPLCATSMARWAAIHRTIQSGLVDPNDLED